MVVTGGPLHDTPEALPQTLVPGSVTEEDSRPQQFKAIEAGLHAERERSRAMAQDWKPASYLDKRDLRSPQLLGENLMRMQVSLGLSCSATHDLIEGLS